MKFIKDEIEYEAFQSEVPQGVRFDKKEIPNPNWPEKLKEAYLAGDIYQDDVDGQMYIKDGKGRFQIHITDVIAWGADGKMVPYDADYFLQAFTPVPAE